MNPRSMIEIPPLFPSNPCSAIDGSGIAASSSMDLSNSRSWRFRMPDVPPWYETIANMIRRLTTSLSGRTAGDTAAVLHTEDEGSDWITGRKLNRRQRRSATLRGILSRIGITRKADGITDSSSPRSFFPTVGVPLESIAVVGGQSHILRNSRNSRNAEPPKVSIIKDTGSKSRRSGCANEQDERRGRHAASVRRTQNPRNEARFDRRRTPNARNEASFEVPRCRKRAERTQARKCMHSPERRRPPA
jgi:hypothetical protein